MKKRLFYALAAFLMLAANFAGPIQVFAEEVGGETEVETISGNVVGGGAESTLEAAEGETEAEDEVTPEDEATGEGETTATEGAEVTEEAAVVGEGAIKDANGTEEADTADGDSVVINDTLVITQDIIDSWSGSFPTNEDAGGDACIGQKVINVVLGEEIDLANVGGSLFLDYPGFCEYAYGVYDIENIVLDLNGFSIGGNDAFGTIIIDPGASLTVKDTSAEQYGNIFNSGNAPVFGVDGTLIIEGGSYDVFSPNDTQMFTGDNAPIIKGGAFNREIDTNYIASGYAEYVLPAERYFNYVVDIDADIDDKTAQGFFLRVGETVDIAENLNDVAKKYLAFTVERAFDYEDWTEYLAMDGTRLTGLKSGEMIAEMTLNKVGGYIYDVPVIVFDEGEDSEVFVKLNSEKLTEEEFASRFADEAEMLRASVGDNTVVGYYDIKAQLVDDTDWVLLDNLGETEQYYTIVAEIPDDLPEVADGYVRVWYFAYSHNGSIRYIMAVDNGDGTVSAMSKEFSPYLLAYVDVLVPVDNEETNGSVAIESAISNNVSIAAPDTGEFIGGSANATSGQGGVVAAVAAATGLVLGFGTVLIAKRKF